MSGFGLFFCLFRFVYFRFLSVLVWFGLVWFSLVFPGFFPALLFWFVFFFVVLFACFCLSSRFAFRPLPQIRTVEGGQREGWPGLVFTAACVACYDDS